MRPGPFEIFWSYKKNSGSIESRAATSLDLGKAHATERSWSFSLLCRCGYDDLLFMSC